MEKDCVAMLERIYSGDNGSTKQDLTEYGDILTNFFGCEEKDKGECFRLWTITPGICWIDNTIPGGAVGYPAQPRLIAESVSPLSDITFNYSAEHLFNSYNQKLQSRRLGIDLGCTFQFLFQGLVGVPEPWTGFLFRPESGGIRPQHP